jgi:hypothetical protein
MDCGNVAVPVAVAAAVAAVAIAVAAAAAIAAAVAVAIAVAIVVAGEPSSGSGRLKDAFALLIEYHPNCREDRGADR